MSYITVKKSDSIDELANLKSKLENDGIKCRIKNEMPDQIINVVPTPLAELQVAEDDLRRAQEILP